MARVLVDVPLPVHLDRPFDYLVPDRLDADAVPGCRVRVRFRGKLVDGYLLERVDTSDFQGRLSWVERVPSPEPVLTPSLLEMARAVADRYGGMLADVVRLAVPPRHAGAEKSAPTDPGPPPERPAADGWARYRHGSSFVDAVHEGRAARAVWQALPGEDWPERLAEAVAVAASAGRGALVVVPDHRDLQRLHAACARLLGESGVVALAAELAPAERYRRWLAVLRGAVRVVVGTRAAMFAPVHHLGLAVVWDDGDELHNYPQVPYPHARDVLTLRAHAAGAALVVGGFARTAEAALLVESGYAHELVAPRADVRSAAPRVTAIGEDDSQLARDPAARAARLPSVAFQAARAALGAGAPVLVQVPRRGYVPALACGDCRERARCRRCAGPLALPGGGEGGAPKPAACRWCGATEAAFRCPNCGSRRLRAVAVGAGRTWKLGRAFSGVPVRTSGGGDDAGDRSRRTRAGGVHSRGRSRSPGAATARPCCWTAAPCWGEELRAAETALRLWFAACVVRPASEGGRVVVMAESCYGGAGPGALLDQPPGTRRWNWPNAPSTPASRPPGGWPPWTEPRTRSSPCWTPRICPPLPRSWAGAVGQGRRRQQRRTKTPHRPRRPQRGPSPRALLHHAQAVRGARRRPNSGRLDPRRCSEFCARAENRWPGCRSGVVESPGRRREGLWWVHLETERLVLREFEAGDLDELVALHSNPDVMQYLQRGEAASAAQSDRRTRSCPTTWSSTGRRGFGYWAAMSDQDAAGFLGWFLFRPPESPDTAGIELGYRLHKRLGQGVRDRGLDRPAAQGFAEQGVTRVFAQTMAVNRGSRRVIGRAADVGTFTEYPDGPIPGAEHGEVEYAVTREEWLARYR